jgi:hypothetical protein
VRCQARKIALALPMLLVVEALKIWLATIGLAVLYGVAHDMVTAHVCVEYFTVGHGNRVPTGSPVLLALGWGALATWWAGAILGVPLALCARAGAAHRLSVRDLLRPASLLLAAIASVSLLFGMCGYVLARADVIALSGWIAAEVPARSHDRFLADAWAHTAAYGAGLLGTLVLCGWALVRRRALMRLSSPRADRRPAPRLA